MADQARRFRDLSATLYPLDTPLSSLPVGGFRPGQGIWAPQAAAVLIAITPGPEPGVVLTVRASGMSQHAGQVALPGGGRLGDESFPLGTALRESAEEVGLDSGRVRPLGLLGHFDTISAWRVTPVVGWVEPPFELTPCPREVRDLFTVPLNEVLDPVSYRRHFIRRDGRVWEFWSMRAQGCWPIWGATAAILRELALRASTIQASTPAG